VAPDPPRAGLALLRVRCIGMTSDLPLPEPLRSALPRLRDEDDRLRVAGWRPGARLAALVEVADREGIGDLVRGIVERVTGPDAGVVVDRPPAAVRRVRAVDPQDA
jgi:hypothetical protein